jgi:hypothetical protein
MPASYPTSAKVFTTKNPGDTILASTDNEQQDEITAIEQDLIGGLPPARGGTGITSYAIGDLLYASASGTLAKLADVATGQVLVSGGVATAPAYSASPTLTAVTAGTVTSTGQVVISGAAAGQIVFPATQNASANANTLDDYEEGTWTPVIGGSTGTTGQSYTTQVGRYVKIGKQVTCWFNVTLSAVGTITGDAQIQGLPFTVENTSNQTASGIISDFANVASAVIYLSLVASPNTTAATIKGTAAAVTSAGTYAVAGIGNTTQLVGCITFTATA